MTLTTLVRHTGTIGRKLLVASTLAFIGLLVGFGCVLLPPAAPIGVVGVAALVLLWVMPDLRIVPEKWTRLMLMPFFFSIQCIPVYYAIILPGLPWISIRRVFLFLFVVPLCIMLSGSSRARHLVVSRFRGSPYLAICLVGFLASVAISTVAATKPAQTVGGDIMLILTVLLPMVGVIVLVTEEQTILRLFKLSLFCLGLNLVAGLVEHFLRRPYLIYALPAYMRDQIIQQNPLAVNAYIIGQGIRNGLYRASSTFTNALTWGELSAMITPMCLHFIAHGKSTFEKSYGCAGFFMCLFSVYLSGSRGAYVGLIGASIAYTTIWALRACRLHPENLAGKIWLTFYSMSSVVAVLAVFFVPRINIMVLGGGGSSYSTQARSDQWALALPKILARPWGYGGGAAADVIHYTAMGGPEASPSVDCYPLNLLVDYGVLGFLFFSAIFFGAVFMCLRIYIWGDGDKTSIGGALGASMIAFLIYRLTLSQIDSLAMAFMLVGLTVVYRSIAAEQSKRSHIASQLRTSTGRTFAPT